MISLPDAIEPRAHIKTVTAGSGIAFSFTDGLHQNPHTVACTRAHLAALSAIRALPALVLEDDVTPFADRPDLTPIPPGTSPMC